MRSRGHRRGRGSRPGHTINGVGERAATDIIRIIANLQPSTVRMLANPHVCSTWTEASSSLRVGEHEPDPRARRMSQQRVRPQGGCTVHASAEDTSTYEQYRPSRSDTRRFSSASSRAASKHFAANAAEVRHRARHGAARRVGWRKFRIGRAGYQFEAARPARAVLRKEIGRYRKFFELEHYRGFVLRWRQKEEAPLSNFRAKTAPTKPPKPRPPPPHRCVKHSARFALRLRAAGVGGHLLRCPSLTALCTPETRRFLFPILVVSANVNVPTIVPSPTLSILETVCCASYSLTTRTQGL